MRLTTVFLLAILAMFVNLTNAFAQGDNLRGSFTVNFFAGIPSCPEFDIQSLDSPDLHWTSGQATIVADGLRGGAALRPFLEGTPHALPLECYQNLTNQPAELEFAPSFQFRNGFLKIDAAGDTEATFTLLVDNLPGSVPANSVTGDDDVWVVMPTWESTTGPESPVVNNVNVKDAYSTMFSLIARSNLDGITEHRGTVGQHGLAQAKQAPNVISNIFDYRQETQNIFLNNHPSEPPESLQYRAFPVTFPNVVQELISVELQIELQDSGSESSFYVEVYDFAVTKDLSSLGLAIIPEPTTLLLAILALAAVPLRVRRG